MSPDALVSLLDVFRLLAPGFTRPGFRNALVIFTGWVLTNGPHAVTQALVATDVSGRRHWEAFHRFFSRGTWDPDRLGLLLLERIIEFLPPGGALAVVIDDTLAAKKGPEVFGIGIHLDAVRSTRSHRVFCFGHVWVVLAVVVHVPFSSRVWALPILFRLYRNEKECESKGHPHLKKTELARAMLDVLLRRMGNRRIHLTMDAAYCNATVMRGLPSSIVVFGAMRPDAALTQTPRHRPGRPGRRPVRGHQLPKPQALARRGRWETCKATLYGKTTTVHHKTLTAQWYRPCGVGLLRIVVVRVDHGAVPFRVFFTTDPYLSVIQILETYAERWAIEVTFRDLKQLFGFADSSARKRQAVERVAPFVGLTFTVLVLWFVSGVHNTALAAPPFRPWYPHKRGLCFADILRTAQRVLAHLDVLDPPRSGADFQESHSAQEPPARLRQRSAA